MKKTFKNRKGFTLAELLIVVAILCALFGVVGVNIFGARKKYFQVQADSNAEIIFEAAQNRLTELFAAKGEDAFAGVTFEIVGEEGTNHVSISSESSAESKNWLFPDRSVSAELISKNWRVEFNKSTGMVYAAFYSDTLRATSYTDEMRIKSNRTDGKVGYFGYDSAEDVENKSYTTMKDCRVRLSVINKDILKVHVVVDIPEGFTGDVKLHVLVRSEDGARSSSLADPITVSSAGGNYTADLILDSLIHDADTTKPNQSFSANFPYNGAGDIKAGENIEVVVYAEYPGEKGVENTPPVSIKTNGLFADYDSSTKTATVRYGRHLQNLNRCDVEVATVIQDRSIDFTDTSDDMWAALYPVAYTSGSVNNWLSNHAYLRFQPIENEYIMEYYGRDTASDTGSRTITGLVVTDDNDDENDVGISGNGGLFKEFSGNVISGVSLAGAYIHAEKDAGGLAGTLTYEGTGGVNISDCYSYLQYSDVNGDSSLSAATMQWITSETGDAGGLVGSAAVPVSFNGCSASSVIYAASGNAGGLFGSANGVRIERSYADSYVYGLNTSGGLGGTATGTKTIKDSYSAGFLYAPAGATAPTAYASGYIKGVSSASNSYTIFDYVKAGAAAPTASDPIDKAHDRVTDHFVKSDSASDRLQYASAYNIIPGVSEPLSPFDFPVLVRSGQDGVGAEGALAITELMHHYGDWNGESGVTVVWNIAANPNIPTNQSEIQKILDPSESTLYPICPESEFPAGWDSFETAEDGVNVFAGWQDTTEGTAGAVYQVDDAGYLIDDDGNRITITDSRVYTATYAAPIKITYQTVYNDRTLAAADVIIDEVPSGSFYHSLSYPDADRYGVDAELIGWYFDQACTNRIETDSIIKTDVTVYAYWKCQVTYKAIKDADNTIPDETYTRTDKVERGTAFGTNHPEESSFSSTELTLDGKWYTDRDCTNEFTPSSRIMENTTVYAHWKCKVDYVASRKVDDAVVDEYPTSAGFYSQLVNYGETFASIDHPEATDFATESLHLDGYWYVDKNYKTKKVGTIEKDTMVYAKWKCLVTYYTVKSGAADETPKAGTDFNPEQYVDYGTDFSSLSHPVEGDYASYSTANPLHLLRVGSTGADKDKTKWFKNRDCTTQMTGQITQDTPVYSKWKCYVTYHGAVSELGSKDVKVEVDYGITFGSLTKPVASALIAATEPLLTNGKIALTGRWYTGYTQEGYSYTEPAVSDTVQITNGNNDFYAQWQIKVTYKSTEPTVAVNEYVPSNYVPYGAKFSEVTEKPNRGDFNESIFELDSKLYSNDGLTSEVDPNGKVTKTNNTVYVKWRGIVLHSAGYAGGFKKFGPNDGNQILNGYADNEPSRPTEARFDGYILDSWVQKENGSAKAIADSGSKAIYDQSGITKVTVIKGDGKYIEDQNIYTYEVAGVKDLYAKWVHPGDDYIYNKASGNVISSTKYVIVDSSSGASISTSQNTNGMKAKCLYVKVGSKETTLETTDCYLYNWGTNEVTVKKTAQTDSNVTTRDKGLKNLDNSCIWTITLGYNGSFYLYNEVSNMYLAIRAKIPTLNASGISYELTLSSTDETDVDTSHVVSWPSYVLATKEQFVQGNNSFYASFWWPILNWYNGYVKFNNGTYSVNGTTSNSLYLYRLEDSEEPIVE